jgi:hypothetical protein
MRPFICVTFTPCGDNSVAQPVTSAKAAQDEIELFKKEKLQSSKKKQM